MNSSEVTPSFAAASGGGRQRTSSEAEINSTLIGAVAKRLAMYCHPSSGQTNQSHEQFVTLCLTLARGIDYGVAKNEVPTHARLLPSYLKQVCSQKNESTLRAAIMVLMISVKNACKMGWFTSKDTEELLSLASEIGTFYGPISEINNKATDFMPIVSSIMSRFYPQLKLGHVIASLEIKPGYGTYMVDFHISTEVSYSQGDSIRLFVAAKDNVDTSSCIISPQQVNFLLNGRGVTRRTNVFMDQGPQLPTEVNKLLKFGANLLQAVGQSNGNYVMLIALMRVIPPSALPLPQDYVQHSTASLSSDSEIIEGPSRICLNCPISFQRIRTPVKGYSCRHYQCFDLSNYLEVNFEQRPSWRCLHCNQSVCFTDLRVDQNMVKILKEVGENFSEVIISADGSWTAASSNNYQNQSKDENLANLQEANEPPGSAISGHPSDNFCNVHDLTEEDNGMDTEYEPPELKPVVNPNVQDQSVSINSSIPPINRCTDEINHYPSAQTVNGPSSGVYESGSTSDNTGSEAQLVGGIYGSLTDNNMFSSIMADGICPLPNQWRDISLQTDNSMSSMALDQSTTFNGLHLPEMPLGQAVMSNEFGRTPMIPRNVSRTPPNLHALPVQMPTRSLQQNFRPTMSASGANWSSLPSQAPPVSGPFLGNFEPQRPFHQTYMNPVHVLHRTSTSLHDHSASQVAVYPTFNLDVNLPMPQTLSHSPHLSRPHQLPRNDYQQARISAGETSNMLASHSTHTIPNMNWRMPHTLSQPPHLSRSFQVPQNNYRQAGVGTSNAPRSFQRVQLVAQRPPMMMRQLHQSTPIQTQQSNSNSSFPLNSGTIPPQAVTRPEDLIDLQSEQSRPRMRGALTGQAYSAALSQLMDQTTQPVQVPSPRLSISALTPLHVLMANRMNAHAQQHNQPSTGNASSITGSSTILPDGPSGAS